MKNLIKMIIVTAVFIGAVLSSFIEFLEENGKIKKGITGDDPKPEEKKESYQIEIP